MAGSTVEALGGLGVMILSIIGLAGHAVHYMLAISVIALGVVLLFQGASIAMEYRKLVWASVDTETGSTEGVELGGGLSAQSLAGIATIVLGILGLLNIAPEILLSIAAIVLGAGAMLGSGAMSRLNALKVEANLRQETAKQVAREAATGTTGAQVLVGMSTIVLGILAVIGFAPPTLDLVATLALGSSVLLSGSAIAARMLTVFQR